MRRIALISLTLGLLAGCQSNTYDWGGYEGSIYRQYADDDYSPSEEIDRLTKEVAKTEAAGKKVPPGKYAHLAYLYEAAGDKRQARKYFEAEKLAFPESAVFVDGMLERMQ